VTRDSAHGPGPAAGRGALDTAALDALAAQWPLGLWVLDTDLRTVRVRPAALAPRSPGARWTDLGLAGVLGEAELRGAITTGVPIRDVRCRSGLVGAQPALSDTGLGSAGLGGGERALSLSAFPLRDRAGRPAGVAVTAAHLPDTGAAGRRLRLLERAGRHIGTTLDVFRTAQELAEAAVPELADLAAVDVLDVVLHGHAPAAGPLDACTTLRRGGFSSERPDLLPGLWATGEVSDAPYASPFARVLADLRPRLVRRLDPGEEWLRRDPRRGEQLRQTGVHSLIVLPLVARGVVLGIAAFYRREGSAPFEEEDLALAADLAGRAAECVDNARRYTREHTLARLLQHSLLPGRLPPSSAVETANAYLPVGSGAWFDVLPLSGSRVALVVGEVSGHGLPAVTAMGQLRTAIQAFAAMDLRPAELLERLHDLTGALADEAAERITVPLPDSAPLSATCLYAVYSPVTRQCELARAGHPAPVLLEPGAEPRVLDVPAGSPLGRGAPSYTATELALPAGSVLALHSAGLHGGVGGQPGQGRATDGLRHYATVLGDPERALGEACDALVAALLDGPPHSDALLLLARTRAFGAAELAEWQLPNQPESAALARRAVESRLGEWGLPDLAFATSLIASELVTNSVRHARGPISLRLIRDRALICEVADGSQVAPHLHHADDEDEGGRGLFLVARFTDNWGARRTARGKTIWTEQPLPTGPGAADGEADPG
jgi:serine phosphatase RsbU (regulator of sigma subunit)/anti-sigma regulatory factor (Ser/Thr protein kinase)